MADLKEVSKLNYGITLQSATFEEIQTGALQRIADATELMAGNYVKLQKDKEMYERWYLECRERNLTLNRRISALQGVITKMKKRNGK